MTEIIAPDPVFHMGIFSHNLTSGDGQDLVVSTWIVDLSQETCISKWKEKHPDIEPLNVTWVTPKIKA